MGLLSAIKKANTPGPPEHSVIFRASATACVVISILACATQAELPVAIAVGSILLVIGGNVFSYYNREKPFPWLKLILAFASISGFVWFIPTVSQNAVAGQLGSVEGPLAILFTWIQVTHAFDVPARRDIGFSLAGSATLMAVAAAQAISNSFAIYVMLWFVFGLAGLLAMWSSMSGGFKVALRPIALTASSVLIVGLLVVAVLPAPHASTSLILPQALAGDVSLGSSAGIVGSGPHGTEPAHAAPVNGATRVGGFLGFAGPLDTAIRASLSNQIVMRVRANRPTYWIAEIFNKWSNQTWTATPPTGSTKQYKMITGGSPFGIPAPSGSSGAGTADYQTFYLATYGPNLIFHASEANEVWFPSSHLFVSSEGTILAGSTMGPGSIYTVESQVSVPSAAQLESASSSNGSDIVLSNAQLKRYTQLPSPNPYANVKKLALEITKHSSNTYDKVLALEAWIGDHTEYSTNIPPLTRGQDTVEEFLFGNRKGYCEQISTSLAVMLRSIGIPAREATGYVPGSYNPITDLWQEEAKDAHAWVQVWFPGYGWQSFDPTAYVPQANPTPGSALAHDIATTIKRLPLIPIGAAVVLIAGLWALWIWNRNRPSTWARAISKELEIAAHRARIPEVSDQTLVSLSYQLETKWKKWLDLDPPQPGPVNLAIEAERATFGGIYPELEVQRAHLKAARVIKHKAHRLHRRERKARINKKNRNQDRTREKVQTFGQTQSPNRTHTRV